MANKMKGQVGFDVDGAHYTLAFSINALCELEEKMGGAVVDLATMMTGSKRFSTMRSVFWCGLTEHHPELTEKDAGKIMTAIGFSKADALIGEAFALAFPEATAAPKAAVAPLPLTVAKPARNGRARTGLAS